MQDLPAFEIRLCFRHPYEAFPASGDSGRFFDPSGRSRSRLESSEDSLEGGILVKILHECSTYTSMYGKKNRTQ